MRDMLFGVGGVSVAQGETCDRELRSGAMVTAVVTSRFGSGAMMSRGVRRWWEGGRFWVIRGAVCSYNQ